MSTGGYFFSLRSIILSFQMFLKSNFTYKKKEKKKEGKNMELLKIRKNRKTITLYPTCKYQESIEKLNLIYDLMNFLSKKEGNTYEEIQEYNEELCRLEIIMPYFKKERIRNGMVYAPYPMNQVIKNILSNYENS